MKRIYAYYTSIPATNQAEEFACANWWKFSWQKAGWDPVMLNRSHAQSCSLYNKLQQKLMNVATTIPQELSHRLHWINARFIRWAALHAAGGGWMSAYDVVNIGFTPQIADKYESKGTVHIVGNYAGLFYATQEHAAHCIRKIVTDSIISTENEKAHVMSDAKILGEQSNHDEIMPLIWRATGTNKSETMKEICDQL